MEMNWHYLNNAFLSKKQKRNYKRLSTIAQNHVDALKANAAEAGIQALIDRTQPLLDDYQQSLQEKNLSKGSAKAYVYTFNELMDQMPEKLAFWDATIQTVFSIKSNEYKTIFAVKRSDIYKGNTDQIVAHINDFKAVTEKFTQLAAINIQIKDFVGALNETRDLKSGKKEKVELSSDTFDQKYDALAVMLYRNLGALIDLYGEDPEQIVRFFMLSLLRSSKKSIKENGDSGSILKIAAGGTATGDFVLKAGKTYLIDVKGDALQVYGGTTANEAPKQETITLTANEENEITSEELGFPANTLMIFKNTNFTASAEVEIFLLDEE